MNYIILDLEWNNAFAGKKHKFFNEIIEFGAVKLDENLNQTDTFSRLVKPKIGKKLRSNIKQLTHITNNDVRSGLPFGEALDEFAHFVGDEDNVLLTWGDSDIRVLIDNNKFLNSCDTIPFIKNYIDLQRYFQIRKNLPLAQQIGLFPAAEMVGLDPNTFTHHRALDDSLITAECLKAVFADNFMDFVSACDSNFYGKLVFKPYPIKSINNSLVDRSMLNCKCEVCNVDAEQLSDWRYANQYFRAVFRCPNCGNRYRVAVRFKKYYDRLEKKKTVSLIRDAETAVK